MLLACVFVHSGICCVLSPLFPAMRPRTAIPVAPPQAKGTACHLTCIAMCTAARLRYTATRFTSTSAWSARLSPCGGPGGQCGRRRQGPQVGVGGREAKDPGGRPPPCRPCHVDGCARAPPPCGRHDTWSASGSRSRPCSSCPETSDQSCPPPAPAQPLPLPARSGAAPWPSPGCDMHRCRAAAPSAAWCGQGRRQPAG